jgi:valyl-tRNA synthetase
MTEIAKIYDPKLTEDKWYQQWLDKKCFSSKPDNRIPFTIVIPPPNVTGILHMGHMLNNTIQDVLVRKARMEGKNACWVPGTDHASIATEAKVVQMLRDQGIKKSDLSRQDFLKHAYIWKDKYGGIILDQLKKLGASCDWDRTDFTMNEHYNEAVINVFIDLYQKGLIYRGLRMINWDPAGKTALSDEEVLHTTENSKLYYVKYKIAGSENTLTIATTRPETILADTAICVNPKDERFFHLHGKKALVPFIHREIPVILDEYVSMEFGTGCLKVTPAHDANDYALGQKHNLEVIDILNEDGTLNIRAQLYVGEDRFEVRKKIAKDLEAAGHIEKIEDYQNQVGRSERTNAIIEPRLSLQWFVDMKKFVEKNPQVVTDVMEDRIKFHPPKFKNTYKHWMDNIRDWCISRQLWWGQRIPAWYDDKGNFFVAKTLEEAQLLAAEAYFPVREHGQEKMKEEAKKIDLKQDEDVVDTWFSSWLWPLEVFGWNKDKNNEELNYYYPTNDLVTAPEIMFFWVMRMIMAGYEYKGEKPFSNVYFTGIVRDKQGRKMSKSLGNSPEPLGLIEKYSADGVRVGMLLSSPAGNDLLFDESLCEQGRNFANKVWNAFRLVKGWEVDANKTANEGNKQAITWFNSRLNQATAELNDLYSKFRINEALHTTYKLVWDDFCAWYLEMIKPEYTDGKSLPIDKETYDATLNFFEQILKLMHPFMPFITEEIWHLLKERKEGDFIMLSSWPKAETEDKNMLEKFSASEELITEIRNFRKLKNISPKEGLQLFVKGDTSEIFVPIVKKLGNLIGIDKTEVKTENAYAFIKNNIEYFIPFTASIDMEAEIARIQKEIEYNKGFLKSVMSKLGNEKFVANAKAEVVAIETKKKDDAEAKIKALEEQLVSLNK